MLWVLLIVFLFLLWQKRHPYVVTREQMRSATEQVLEQNISEREWRSLMQKRIPRDRYLEGLRVRIAEIPFVVQTEGGPPAYAPSDRQKIITLLDELRTKRGSMTNAL